MNQAFFGTFAHTPTPHSVDVLDHALVLLDDEGVIRSILQPGNEGYDSSLASARQSGMLISTGRSQFMLPGLIDLHVHAPQWPQLGKALHLPLQDWLMNATFPLEARYADIDFARPIYTSLVNTLLANGTTTAVYFATVHQAATELLADICLAQGQRALVGKVAMDDPLQCPDYYRDASAQDAIAATEALIKYVQAKPDNHHNRVLPIVTPRFIPSCSNECLLGLGELASRYHCHVQTHCSESDWEHHYVLDRLGKTDSQALHDFGLLNRQTILAHANFITDADKQLIKRQGSGIAHCPLSNSYFADSVFPLRDALNRQLRIGLGTDISGGPSASLFDSCRQAMSSSRMLESGTDAEITASNRGRPNSRIDFVEAFYLATAGGADVLDLPIGQFAVGYKFDALLLDAEADDSNLMHFPELDSAEDLFQKTLYAATRANIKGVWVDGCRRAG